VAGLAVCVAAVIKVDVLPAAGAVAIGASAVIVVRRRVVAGFAVDSTIVVKAHIPPTVGVVAVGTLAGIVIER